MSAILLQEELQLQHRLCDVEMRQNLPMDTIGSRARARRKELGLTQVQVAHKAGMKQSTLSDLERGRNDSSMDLIPLASALRCRPEWLKTGKGEREYQEVTGTTDTGYAVNVEPGPAITGKVPLISWVQAGAFCLSPDLFQPGDAEDWLLSVQKLGPHAYALRVHGDSMTAPYGRSYPHGCIIFVDPDCPVTNGCRVIAKIPGTDEATFKVYSEDAGERFLKPLNTQYPTIKMTPDMVLCGVVKGYYMPD